MICSVNSPRFCWRIGRPVAGTGFRACRKHRPPPRDIIIESEEDTQLDRRLSHAKRFYVDGHHTLKELEEDVDTLLRSHDLATGKQLPPSQEVQEALAPHPVHSALDLTTDRVYVRYSDGSTRLL